MSGFKVQNHETYDKQANTIHIKERDRVLLWSVKFSKREAEELRKPQIKPYRITKRTVRVGYILESEVYGKVTRSNANRLRIIRDQDAKTGNPADGVFPDSLQTVKKISGEETSRNNKREKLKQHFKVQPSGKRSPR